VLLAGETGSGKGEIARRIHGRSPRAQAPFVELNCAGLEAALTESELFGHERGSFTGAACKKLGLLEVADGGTIFLDEIAEMDLPVQAKLLKALEDGRFRRLGGISEVEVDVRLIAASHRDLARAVEAGTFRSDLYYRLNVFTVGLPPLRERTQDIAPLATRFLAKHWAGAAPVPPLSENARAALETHSWPGNVRELQNAMERAAIVGHDAAEITLAHLPPMATGEHHADPLGPLPTLRDAERDLVTRAVRIHEGNIRAAAHALGVSRTTLYRKIERYGVPVPR